MATKVTSLRVNDMIFAAGCSLLEIGKTKHIEGTYEPGSRVRRNCWQYSLSHI